MKLSNGLIAAVLLTVTVPVCAQSLGDLAKKEQERRKTLPPATKTYTNEDLKKLPPSADDNVKPADKAKADDAIKAGDPAKPGGTKPQTANSPEPAKEAKYCGCRLTT